MNFNAYCKNVKNEFSKTSTSVHIFYKMRVERENATSTYLRTNRSNQMCECIFLKIREALDMKHTPTFIFIITQKFKFTSKT